MLDFFFGSPGSGTQCVMTKQVKNTHDRSKWKQRRNGKKKKHPHKLHDCVATGDNFLPALLAYFNEI
jgi:hypothetical protein